MVFRALYICLFFYFVSCFFFFFSSRRRHTRCLSDWSSDVCSSDLRPLHAVEQDEGQGPRRRARDAALDSQAASPPLWYGRRSARSPRTERRTYREIGRASCRERV